MTTPHPLIGLYGGAFDPVHLGHLETARELLARFPFTELRLLPAALSPLKQGHADAHHRLAMLKLAVAEIPRLTVDDRELRRAPPSYTIDTLRRVRATLGPDTGLAFILGLDSFLELPRWKEWQALTSMAHLVVVGRPGCHPPIAPELAAWLEPRLARDRSGLDTAPAGRVLLAATPPLDIASRVIRAAVRAGGDTAGWLNPAVRDYIDHHHLYRGDADPQ